MRISDWSSDVCSSDLFAAPRTVVIGQQIDEKRDLLFLPRVNHWNYLTRALICRSIWGWSRNIMAQRPRQFWRGSIVALAAVSLVLPPALAAMTRSDSLRDLSLSETLLGQFTPASGDQIGRAHV